MKPEICYVKTIRADNLLPNNFVIEDDYFQKDIAKTISES